MNFIEPPLEFWRLRAIKTKAGLSKTEIYRRMKETDPARNPFPPSWPYRGGNTGRGAGVFWFSADVQAWQLAELRLAPPPFPNWPSATLLDAIAMNPLRLLG